MDRLYKFLFYFSVLALTSSACVKSTNKQNSIHPSEVPSKETGSLLIKPPQNSANTAPDNELNVDPTIPNEVPKLNASDLKEIYFQPAPCNSGLKCAIAGLEIESSAHNDNSMKQALRYFIQGCYLRFIATCDAAILLINKLYSNDRATLREHLNFAHHACLLRAIDSCFEAASMAEIRKEAAKQKDYWNKACQKSLLKPNLDSRDDFLNLIRSIPNYKGLYNKQAWQVDQSKCPS